MGKNKGKSVSSGGAAAKSVAAATSLASKINASDNDGLSVVYSGGDVAEHQNVFSNILLVAILGLICLLSFAIRLFAVVRWESVSVVSPLIFPCLLDVKIRAVSAGHP